MYANVCYPAIHPKVRYNRGADRHEIEKLSSYATFDVR